jgi:two-component system, chemotaxis family, response regulator Rcp1
MKDGAHCILLVEDNPGDVRLIKESLRMYELEYVLTHFENVDDAIRAVNAYGVNGASIPDLILLDYNLPRGDAGDILAAAARNPALAGVPKAVVTSSVAPKDMERSFQLGAHCFINKPPELDAFLTEVGSKVAAMLRGESVPTSPGQPPSDGSDSETRPDGLTAKPT